MSQIIEVNEDGGLYLPATMVEQTKPHKRFFVEVSNGTLVLRPAVEAQPFWATATPEEWVQNFREWVASHTDGPGLPDEALRRENMYD